MEPLQCKLAELSLNLDMSGQMSCCNLNNLYLKDELGNTLRLDKDSVRSAWTSPTRRKLLGTLEKGIPHPYCRACWNMEAVGSKSIRQHYNTLLADVESLPDQPRIMIIKHGNKCNSACRSCSAHSSTLWYKDAYAMEETDVPYKVWLKQWRSHEESYNDNQDLKETLAEWSAGIVFFDLYGGEPLLHPLTYDIVDHAVTSGHAANQDIQMHINGTIWNDKLVEQLKQYKSVSIGYSVDAVGERNDYIRMGSKWDVVLSNLERWLEVARNHPNFSVSIKCTGMSHNVYYLGETFDFFSRLGVPMYFTNRVTDVDKREANMMYLPEFAKEAVKEKLMSYEPLPKYKDLWEDQRDCTIRFISKNPTDYDTFIDSFWTRNHKLDLMRRQDYGKVFPEFNAILEDHYGPRQSASP